VLGTHGYEPGIRGDAVVLANCSFHALARVHTTLVCEMNLNLIAAMLDELGHPRLHAGLDPAPDRCCVKLTAEPA
jgi:predicted ArsR family transcriptional regulator